MHDYDVTTLIRIVFTLTLLFVGVVAGLTWESELSQETLDDICINLTGNETAVGKVEIGGKLLCKIPSFDSTHNIIIRQGEKNEG